MESSGVEKWQTKHVGFHPEQRASAGVVEIPKHLKTEESGV
jgi:hypothetical protein